MPAPPLANSLEGGTDTTTVSVANSGGTSGDAFSAIAGTAITFSATQARGALSMKLDNPVATTTYGSWTGFGTLTSNVYFRCYLWLAATPVTNAWYLGVMRDQADLEYGGLIITTGGKVQCRNNANSSIAGSVGTVNVNIGSWFRLEWRSLPSLTAGEIEWRLYNTPDSASSDDTVNSTGNALRADLGGIRWGSKSTGPATILYMDDLAVSTAGWIGPSVVTPAVLPLRETRSSIGPF